MPVNTLSVALAAEAPAAGAAPADPATPPAGLVRAQYERVCGVAKSIYSSATNAEQHPWIKAGIDRLPAVPLVASHLPKGTAAVESVIDRLDNGITALDGRVLKPAQSVLRTVQTKVSTTGDSLRLIVSPAWLESVDAILRQRKEAISFKSFYAAALTTIESAKPASFEQFQAELRSRLAKWDDRTRAVALHFYETAQKSARDVVASPASLRAKQTVSELQTAVQAQWERTFVTNAEALYARAMDHYLALTEKRSAATLKARDFVNGLRAQLDEAWTERLAEPLTAFFESAQQTSRAELVVRVRETKLAGSVATAVTGFRSWISQRWSQALALGQRSVDVLLPEGAEPSSAAEPNEPVAPPTLYSIAATVIARTEARVSAVVPRVKDVAIAVPAAILAAPRSCVRRARAAKQRASSEIVSPLAAVAVELKHRSAPAASSVYKLATATAHAVAAQGLNAPRRLIALAKKAERTADEEAVVQQLSETKQAIVYLLQALRPQGREEHGVADEPIREAVPL